MNTFWRAILYTLPYRRRMVWSVLCGVVVAVFWAGNLTFIYPVLKVLDGHSAVSWLDESIKTEARESAARDQELVALRGREAEIAQLKADLSPAAYARQLALLSEDREWRTEEITRRQRAISRYEWYKPYLVRWTPENPFHTILLLLALMTGGVLIKGVFDYLQEVLATGVVQRGIFDLRNDLFARTMRLDLTHFSEAGTHELLARGTNDVETLANGMKALYGKVLLEPLKCAACLAAACYFDWRLTALAVPMFALGAIAMGLIGRFLKKMSRRNLESMSRMYKILQESFLNIRVVQAFARERREQRRLFGENKRYFRQSMRLNRADAFGGPLLELMAALGLGGVMLCGAYLVLSGNTSFMGIRLTDNRMDTSKLLFFYALIAGMSDPLRKVFSVFGRVQRGVAASERIFAAFDKASRVPQAPQALALPRHGREIVFEDVCFGYGRGGLVLHDVSFAVRAGETIAIVGATGSGKTSLINLVPRFHDPLAGSVRVDGHDLRDVTLDSLREQLGLVTQQTLLFDDTVHGNIAYGFPAASRAQVIAAAKSAYAHRFIEDMPNGYDTRIGEMGDTLSGGQRQRLALARAILRDPSILILDEATSSLDVESEALIHKALREFARGRTTLIVTHRLSTLDIADRVLVLNQGRVETIGTPAEALRGSPSLRRLHEVQAKSA